MTELVLVGGGHSHALALKAIAHARPPGLRLTLVSREVLTPYSGMLPGCVAGHYTPAQMHIDLAALAARCGAEFVHAAVVKLEPKSRRVHLAGGGCLEYDLASLNVGATPSLAGVRASPDAVVPVKPIAALLTRWQALRERILSAPHRLRIAVVGAGAGGVEMLLAMRHAIAAAGADLPQFHLFCTERGILPTHPPAVRRIFDRLLDEHAVRVHRSRVREVAAGVLCTDDGSWALDEVVWATGASAPDWLAASGIATTAEGFVSISPTLQTSDPRVFAAGDCATMTSHPREKAGVFAVRQAAPLARNLMLAGRGQPPRDYLPQRRFLRLISTGGRDAVASRGGKITLRGGWVWRWKDFIDRRFMARFTDEREWS